RMGASWSPGICGTSGVCQGSPLKIGRYRLLANQKRSTMRQMTGSSECVGFRQAAITRRHLLQAGSLGLLGLHLPGLLQAAERGSRKARVRAVIFLHQYGGPSHHDTFDMKPNAPDEVRGEFKPIATKVPGLSVCERLPRVAQVMDKVTLVRSL